MKDFFPPESEMVSYNDCKDFNELLKDLCALANNQGGTIYCGVNSKGKTIGIDPTYFQEQLHLHLKTTLTPLIPLEKEIVLTGHKYIVLLKVEKSDRIISFNTTKQESKVYFRLGTHSVEVSKILLSLIKLQKGILISKIDINENAQNELVNLVRTSNGISLSQIYLQSNLSKREIDKLLPYLIHQNQISLQWSNDKIEFIS